MSTYLLHFMLLYQLLLAPLHNKTTAPKQTKPSSPSLCLCRVTFLCHEPCMPLLCCFTPMVGMAWAGREGSPSVSPRPLGESWWKGVEKASCLECPGPIGLMAICPEEMTSGQVSEAGQWLPSLPLLSFILEKRRCWGKSPVGKRAQNCVGGEVWSGSSCHGCMILVKLHHLHEPWFSYLQGRGYNSLSQILSKWDSS